ncbi:MAG: hypothetical protein HY512_01765 [Candidatus Aenigmarchaeota archaeon]|nr:hypothetical protein [Candidatus Aenigmarchaeota archaeon]
MPYITGNWDGEGHSRPVRLGEKSASRKTVGSYGAGLSGNWLAIEYRGQVTVHAVNTKEPDSMLLFFRRGDGLSYVRADVGGLSRGEIVNRVMQDFGVRELSDLIGRSFDLDHKDGLTALTPLPDEPEQHAAQPEDKFYSWRRV